MAHHPLKLLLRRDHIRWSGGPNALSQPAHDRSAADALLLSSLDVRSSLYHLGQYCGAWNASTSGARAAST